MAVNFADCLSAEPAAYDALYQNMKCGLNAGKELSEFLRERSGIEETNSKLLAKLAKQANGGCAQGAFAPVWSVFRGSAEKLSALHQHAFQKISELVKDVSRYADDLHKKHRSVKESESGTLEAAIAAQNAKQALQKAGDLRATKAAEVERLKRDGASPKDLEKAEAKLRKLRDESDSLADKYAAVKLDFQKRMALTCKHFQDVEEAHLKQMKQFVNAYLDLVQNNHDLVGQVHVDFRRQYLELTVERLLERFALDKRGSLEASRSAAEELAEIDGHRDRAARAPKKEPSFAQKTSRRTTSLLNLFTPSFQSRDEPGGAGEAAPCSAPSSPSGDQAKPDDARPGAQRNPLRESRWFLRSKRAKAKLKRAKKKKDDSADEPGPPEDGSDLDEKEEEAPPKDAGADAEAGAPGSPEVDEDGYTLRPTRARESEEPKSSDSDSDSDVDAEADRKIRVEIKPLGNGTGPASASVDELVATVEGLTLFPTRRGSAATASLDSERRPSSAVPRPPSRRSESAVSRGPSPLTIGMADTIPLAVAFHEIVHCYFKGADEAECRVKMSGDMMVSFPTGIVGALANNPNPAKLRFRLKNSARLEAVLPNRRLVSADPSDSTVEFDMSALTSLLKKQSETNPGAAYFNVDILKYQIKPKPGAASCPFQLVAYWKCERTHTDLKIDYKYNSHAMSSPSPLLNLSVSVPVGGGVVDVGSKPTCSLDGPNLVWKFTELSQHSDGGGVGSLKARAELADGPSAKATASSQFNCEGATLSGVDFELVGAGYRLSLVKRRFVSGKYICEGE